MRREEPKVIRLKRYKTYLQDGRSSVEYEPAVKGEVVVAVVIGTEPQKIVDQSQLLNVSEEIRKLAKELDEVMK